VGVGAVNVEVHVQLPASVDFFLGGIPVTNTVVAAWLSILVLVVIGVLATRNMRLVPSGLQNLVEYAIEGLASLCEQVAGARARSFLPLVGTLFLFILVSNWMGILPFYAENDWAHEVPWTASHQAPLRSANSDLNAPVAMALVVFLWTQVTRIRYNGLLGWLKHLTLGPPPVLELVSEISRPVSLALRLFGNILAGEILLLVMSGLIAVLIPAIFMAFELFVGIVQALIFAVLTLAFLSLAAAHPGGDEEHGHEAAH
jgi:F-type H+-transporting ATPase subunit a